MQTRRPVIGVPADRRMLGKHPFHAVGEKYLRALTDAAGVLPIVIPSFGLAPQELVELVDGVMLTGSPSNVEPRHYAGPASVTGTLHDPDRDASTLPLIPAAIRAGVPVLGICRGFQEMNVACGGSLHQRVHEVGGYMDHRDDESAELDVQYGPAHDVLLDPGGMLRRLAGGADRIRVNSLHWQGIDRLGSGLAVEARAPDGLVEAFSVEGARFAVAVQWHPEWKVMENPFSRALFAAFGDACRERART